MGAKKITKTRKTYASRLTKEMLIKSGYELITEDGTVIKNGKQIIPTQDKRTGYLMIFLYDFDEDGNKIKIPITKICKGCKKPSNTYNYKLRAVGLHRAMWAWIYGVVEEGYVIDHKNNKHTNIEDYNISNLQIISQRENVIKDREASIIEFKCKLDRPLSHYEDKLAYYEDLYQKAVKEGNQEEAHKQRCNIFGQRARIRYWLSHKEEAEALIAKKQAAYLEAKLDSDIYHAKARVIKLLTENINKRHAEYNDALETKCSKHETTLIRAEWKRAIKELNDFKWAAFNSDKSYLPELINIYTKRALSNF